MWAAKQIAKTYESKLGPGKSKEEILGITV